MTAIDSIGMMMILRACGVFASGREIIESNAKDPCLLLVFFCFDYYIIYVGGSCILEAE